VTAAPALRLVDVHAGYPARTERRDVLRGASLQVEAGEAVVVAGTNGSGKTTLLRVAAGTLAPRQGSVEVLGRPLGTQPRAEVARAVAVLSQEPQLPAGFRADEVVGFGRIPHARTVFGSGPGDAEAVAAALRDADVDRLRDRAVDRLSGGERQRVALAMALAQEPRLLLLDEPTLHLDLAHQLGLLELIGRLRRTRGLAVVAVLHDLNLAAALADRVELLVDGRLVPAGRDGMPIDPSVAARAFGVPVETARTEDGRRVLAIGAAGAPTDEPSRASGTSTG
jgi:iron complex transport system ATP-binding protein